MWRVHPLLGTQSFVFQHGVLAKALQRVQLTQSAQRLASFKPAASAASAESSDSDEGGSLYSNPELYDRAFGFRDYDKEVGFLRKIWQKHRRRKLLSFIELGCGPARHAMALQQQTGAKGAAMDNSAAMLAYVEQLAGKAGAQLQLVDGDMQSFGLEEPVDLSFMLMGTFYHLMEQAGAMSCLRSIAAALKPDGLLVLELAHAADCFDGSWLQEDAWDIQPEAGQPGLLVSYGREDDDFHCLSQVLERSVRISEISPDKSEEKVLVDTAHSQRLWTYQEISLLTQVCGLEILDTYGDLDTKVDMHHIEAYRTVLVLQHSQQQKQE